MNQSYNHYLVANLTKICYYSFVNVCEELTYAKKSLENYHSCIGIVDSMCVHIQIQPEF